MLFRSQMFSLKNINKERITDVYFPDLMFYHNQTQFIPLEGDSMKSIIHNNYPVIIKANRKFLFKEVRNYCGVYLIPELCDIVASYISQLYHL